MLEPFVQQVAKYSPDSGRGIKIFDSFSGENIRIFLYLAWCQVKTHHRLRLVSYVFERLSYGDVRLSCMHVALQNDIRGLPSTTCGSHPPCLTGGCHFCDIGGLTIPNAKGTYMPGAVRFLHPDDPKKDELERRYFHTFIVCIYTFNVRYCLLEYNYDVTYCHGIRYMAEFAHPTWQELATIGPPERRTKEKILEEAEKATSGVRDSDAAFHGVSVFSKLLPYHDVAKHNKICFAHNFANLAKQSIAFLANSKGSGKSAKVRFSEKRMTVCTYLYF